MTRIEKVARLLAKDMGLEIGQVFKIQEHDSTLQYLVSKHGILENDMDWDRHWDLINVEVLGEIIDEELTIIKTDQILKEYKS